MKYERSKNGSSWSTRKKLVIAAVVLIYLIFPAIIFGSLFVDLYQAFRTLHEFGDALIAKRYVYAYSMTTQELQEVSNYSTFLKVHGHLTQRVGDLKEIKVDQMSVKERNHGWYATSEADLIFSRGTLTFDFTLKKENQSWKIYSYREQ
jgi:hypothetical protein